MKRERILQNKKLLARIGEAIQSEQQKKALMRATEHFRSARFEVFSKLKDPEGLREEARAVRVKTIDNLEFYLGQLKKKVSNWGGKVAIVKTSEEAVQYISKLVEEKGAKLVVKSKSMTAEEIELNKALEKRGVKVVETDLGERIVQLAHERPSHMVAPAFHMTVEQVAELFSKDLGHRVPPEPSRIVAEARKSLRESFLNADIGITGVNLAIAETGSIALVTNEGNARFVTALPPIHIALMGLEKVVPTLQDAMTLLKVLPRSATGQKISTYVSFISGIGLGYRSDRGKREFHLLIIDNGRSEMKKSEYFRDALYCIRCGACMNTCPTYRVVGGHIFGHIYTGPIGIPWTAFVHGIDKAIEFSPLCINCGLCEDICPVKIDIPEMIMRVKQIDVKRNGMSRVTSFISKFEDMSKLASMTAPLSNWLTANRLFRYLMEKFTGIDRRRPLPKYHRETFMKWFKMHESKEGLKVAYFVDVYANYNDPDLGRAVVEILERNGCQVAVPEQKNSGVPLMMYGNIKGAEEIVRFNISSFSRLVKEGYKVVASEPTAAFCLKRLYPYLLPSDDSRLLAENSYELFEFLEILHSQNRFNTEFTGLSKKSVAYHIPCHLRPIAPHKPSVKFMQMIGLDVRVVDHGCCGMGGTYGYKKGLDGYDVSIEVGRPLFEDIMKPDTEFVITESSVCKIQMETGASKQVIHPAKLLRDAYRAKEILGQKT